MTNVRRGGTLTVLEDKDLVNSLPEVKNMMRTLIIPLPPGFRYLNEEEDLMV
jgi:hypothetical protein